LIFDLWFRIRGKELALSLCFQAGGFGFCGSRLAQFRGDSFTVTGGLSDQVEHAASSREFELGDAWRLHDEGACDLVLTWVLWGVRYTPDFGKSL
jgi:hypothetical protein